jgi:hypothetical protein
MSNPEGSEPIWYFEVVYARKDEAKSLGAQWFPKPIKLWGTHDPAAAKRLAQIFRSANLEPLSSATAAGSTPNLDSSDPVWYFEVVYARKDEARSLGAKWFPKPIQCWGTHDPAAAKRLAQVFKPANLEPLIFIGEDRTFGGSQLYVDLIPSTAWKVNARSMLQKGEWDKVRRYIYRRANYCCEACGATESTKIQLEAHERWDYIEDGRGGGCQKLKRLIALCHWCHAATHMGLSQIQGRGDRAMQHLAQVNGISLQDARQRSREAFMLWHQRNHVRWVTDISMLKKSGILVVEPPSERNLS